jgi:FMN reductase
MRIVGIGGTSRPGSSTELAARLAIEAAAGMGVETAFFDGAFLLDLPHYGAPASTNCARADEFVDAVRNADGVIIASPGYHGSISGLVKNAVDYLEETAKDGRVYLDGVPVGLIATAYGWQATGSTLAALRSIVHSLRGWPTPFGAAINASGGLFTNGLCTDERTKDQLQTVGRQVYEFALLRARIPQTGETAAA